MRGPGARHQHLAPAGGGVWNSKYSPSINIHILSLFPPTQNIELPARDGAVAVHISSQSVAARVANLSLAQPQVSVDILDTRYCIYPPAGAGGLRAGVRGCGHRLLCVVLASTRRGEAARRARPEDVTAPLPGDL